MIENSSWKLRENGTIAPANMFQESVRLFISSDVIASYNAFRIGRQEKLDEITSPVSKFCFPVCN